MDLKFDFGNPESGMAQHRGERRTDN